VTLLCCLWSGFALYKLTMDRRKQLYEKNQAPFHGRGLFLDGEWVQGGVLVCLYLARFAVLLHRARQINLFLHEADVPDISKNDVVNTLFIGNVKNDELERLNKHHRASLRAWSLDAEWELGIYDEDAREYSPLVSKPHGGFDE
jgi:hypothetical protein